MKQVRWSRFRPDAFVFDDTYVLDLSSDAMSISHFDPSTVSKPEVTEANIRQCPKIQIDVLGTNSLRGLLTVGQLTIAMSGPRVGVVKHNDNYSVAADGAYWRRITSATVVGKLTRAALALSVSVNAGPVETLVESQPPGSLSATDRQPFAFSRSFVVPADVVPEFLDLDRAARSRFLALIEGMKS